MRFWPVLLLLLLVGCGSRQKDTKLPPEKEGVHGVISRRVGDVVDCYQAASKKNPELAGKLVLEWEINPIGDALNPKVIQSVNRELDDCMIKKVSRWAFPPPPDGKVVRVRYPFVFAPPPKPEDVKAPSPEHVKVCEGLERSYAELCVRDESGQCAFNETQLKQILGVLQTSPRLPSGYVADLNRWLKKKKMTEAEIKGVLAKLGDDCWSLIHLRIWDSIFHTMRTVGLGARTAETKRVLRERTVGLPMPNPTLLGISVDLAILNKAAEVGLIQPKGQAKKDLVFLKNRAKNLRMALYKDWSGGKKPEADEFAPPEPANLSKVPDLLRKELKMVKTMRGQLREWDRKFKW